METRWIFAASLLRGRGFFPVVGKGNGQWFLVGDAGASVLARNKAAVHSAGVGSQRAHGQWLEVQVRIHEHKKSVAIGAVREST